MPHCDPGAATVSRVSRAEYEAHCAALASQCVSDVHVQVRQRGVTHCGRVLQCDTWAPGADWFKVRTHLGTGWVPSANLRLCSGLGDGRCLCEAEPPFAVPRWEPSR